MGFFSGIGKFFKKAFKVVRKVLPIALGVGALIFSGGAALGLAPFGITGGFSGAVSALTSGLGLTGTLASTVTGAITNAGFGALAGGVLSGATGGDVLGGMAQGALAGGVLGGFSGALSGPASVAGGATGQTGTQLATNAPTVTGAAPAAASNGPAGNVFMGSGPQFGQAAAPAAGAPAAGVAVPPAGAGTPFVPPATASPSTGFMGLLEKNQTLIGNTLSGLGQGYLSGQESDAAAQREEERYNRVSGSYSIDPAVYGAPRGGDASRYQTPEQKYGRKRAYEFDAGQNKIISVA